jgi:Rrf2 family iron-sulfur cluster assembly transcriptional regulator
MLSQSGIHAIRAMVTLAALPPDEYCGVAVIATATGSPRNYLGKLLLQLSRHGLVDSRTGLGGGFRLSQPADRVRLFDIMAAIEDAGRWTECAFTNNACSDVTPCMVHARWSRVREAFLTFLRDTTIAELATNHQQIETLNANAQKMRALSKRS